jgi:flavodoxin
MSKKLVAYFSASGVTAKAAKNLAEAAGADLFEIKPEVPYTQADLDWHDKNSRSSVEMRDSKSRPQIAAGDARIADYDVIFVGFPIWWYVAPTIINTFLESYDFSGKTIIPFCTHAGSGNAGTQSKIQAAVPNATVKEVLAISGTDTQNNQESVKKSVTEWLGK